MWKNLKTLFGLENPQAAPAATGPLTDGEQNVCRATRNLPGHGSIEPDPLVLGFSPPPPPITYPGESPFELRWIDASESPFGVRVLDCRSVAHRMVSTSKSPEVLDYFASQEALGGEQFRTATPANSQAFALDLCYSGLYIPETEGPVYLAQVMEDKWDIFRFGDALFFVRSWSGTLVHRATFAAPNGVLVITEVSTEASRASSDPGLWEITRCEIDFLLRTHLHRERVPVPLPPGLAGSAAPESVAMLAFGRFGRWASFATEADTTRVTWGDQRLS
jgi:hypothetical protein